MTIMIGRSLYGGCDVNADGSSQWASYQIRKIVGYACAGNVGNGMPAIDFKGNC